MSYRPNQELPPAVTYRRPDLLKDYVDDDYKILPQRRTRLKAPAQRQLTREIKRARKMGLLPYTPDQANQ